VNASEIIPRLHKRCISDQYVIQGLLRSMIPAHLTSLSVAGGPVSASGCMFRAAMQASGQAQHSVQETGLPHAARPRQQLGAGTAQCAGNGEQKPAAPVLPQTLYAPAYSHLGKPRKSCSPVCAGSSGAPSLLVCCAACCALRAAPALHRRTRSGVAQVGWLLDSAAWTRSAGGQEGPVVFAGACCRHREVEGGHAAQARAAGQAHPQARAADLSTTLSATLSRKTARRCCAKRATFYLTRTVKHERCDFVRVTLPIGEPWRAIGARKQTWSTRMHRLCARPAP
jgi:hypothetical protein